MCSITSSNFIISECGSNLVNTSKVRFTILQACHQESVPEWVKLAASVVHDACQPSVQSFWFKTKATVITFIIDTIGKVKNISNVVSM